MVRAACSELRGQGAGAHGDGVLHPVGSAETGWMGSFLPAMDCPTRPVQVPGLSGHRSVTPHHDLEQLESNNLAKSLHYCLHLTTLAFRAFSDLIQGHKAPKLCLHS